MHVLSRTQARVVLALAEQRERLIAELTEVNAALQAHAETVRVQMGLEAGPYNFHNVDGQNIALITRQDSTVNKEEGV